MESLRRASEASLPRWPAACAIAVLVAASPLAAQSSAHAAIPAAPSVHAVERAGTIALDGRLDEGAWAAAPAATDFLQSQPNEGEPATQRTEVRFLIDAEALYVGARMFDSEGAKGVRARLSRRDADNSADELEVIFDTYHDRLGRTVFSVGPSGSRGDAYGPGGSNTDESWDPVWEVKTTVDSLGWTAEMRIPLSQLHFPTDSLQTWGLQLWRTEARTNEISMWSFWRRNEQGGPSRFGELEGIRIANQPGRAEALPYVVASSSFLNSVDAGNPFRSSRENHYRAGLDLKYVLTPTLTLAATVNPDFGQVEVDPAVVNLSAFETFFPERRPFFVEGSGLFDYGSFWCHFCSNASSLDLFYSRRIGRSPQGASIARDAGDYADIPESTTILGAAKITGRTPSGYSIALLDAVTSHESAHVLNGTGQFDVPVEPATNYFVARIKRDLLGGNLVVGGMATSTVRSLNSAPLEGLLNRHAEAAGLDTELWWGKHTYHVLGQFAVSQIGGSADAILRAQRSSARYFQRPDREGTGNGLFSDAYDPEATSLRGFAGYFRVAKDAGNWEWESSLNVRSPGFEVNDLSFLTRADYIWMNANLVRHYTKPTSWYRSLWFDVGGQQQFNFDGDRTDGQVQAYAQYEAPNYWNFSGFVMHRFGHLDDRIARGGPQLRTPAWNGYFLNVSTNSRHAVSFDGSGSWGRDEEGLENYSLYLGATYHPVPSVSVSVGPNLSRNWSSYQYVTSVGDPTATDFYGRRYVFATLDQRTLSMDTRLSMTFTPTLSLELFAQPFIASGSYSHYKEFAAPRVLEKTLYGRDIGTIAAAGEGFDREFTVDPDAAGPAQPFTFGAPDFNFRSLRGNAVLRWEYRPGSTLFLVWTQQRSDTEPVGDLSFGRDRAALFAARPDNIFLVKVNYWVGF